MLADVYRRAAEETLGWHRIWEATGSGQQKKKASQRSRVTSETAFLQPYQTSFTYPVAPIGFYSYEYINPRVVQPVTVSGHPVPVEANLGLVIFAAHWNKAPETSGILSLRRPDDSVVYPNDPDVVGHRVYGSSSGHEQYIIRYPQAGTWNVSVHGLYGDDAEYLAIAEVRSNAELLLLSPTAINFGTCAGIPVRVAMVDHEPIRNASIVAEITKSDGSAEVLILYDDGLHDDGQANDGIYGNVYSPCQLQTAALQFAKQTSTYQIRIEARGTSNLGQAVSRSTTKSFVSTSFKYQVKPYSFNPYLLESDSIEPHVIVYDPEPFVKLPPISGGTYGDMYGSTYGGMHGGIYGGLGAFGGYVGYGYGSAFMLRNFESL